MPWRAVQGPQSPHALARASTTAGSGSARASCPSCAPPPCLRFHLHLYSTAALFRRAVKATDNPCGRPAVQPSLELQKRSQNTDGCSRAVSVVEIERSPGLCRCKPTCYDGTARLVLPAALEESDPVGNQSMLLRRALTPTRCLQPAACRRCRLPECSLSVAAALALTFALVACAAWRRPRILG